MDKFPVKKEGFEDIDVGKLFKARLYNYLEINNTLIDHVFFKDNVYNLYKFTTKNNNTYHRMVCTAEGALTDEEYVNSVRPYDQ
jgi:hypothetical protein